MLSRTKSTTNSFCCNLTEAKAKRTLSNKNLYKQLRKTMMRDQPRWSVYLHWLLVLDVELLVKALVTTWETIPTGQKRRQSETECLVSILFSKPSLKTCLHRNKQNMCYEKHVLDFWLKTKTWKLQQYLAAKRSITRRWIQAEARVISLENIFAIPDNCK